MKRFNHSVAVLALGGCIGLVTAADAFGQSSESGRQTTRRETTTTPPPSNSSPPPSRPPTPSNIRPLPDSGHVPLPEGGGRTPLGGSGRLPDVPSAGERIRNAPRDVTENEQPTSNNNDVTGGRTAGRGRGEYLDDGRRNRGPRYYDYRRYDRYRYDGPYRYYDDRPVYPPVPSDYGYGRDLPATEPPGAFPGDVPADAPAAGPGGGGLLPPDELMDDDAPAALRKALDGSPQYREATAQLLRAWADYARAAEQVLLRLRSNAAYQKALADLKDAESRVAALRDRGGNVPAVNLVTAAQRAMLARRAVRAQEEKALDADPNARRMKQLVDQAIERRNTIRDEIAAKLPAEAR
jgi:hypothetical protein